MKISGETLNALIVGLLLTIVGSVVNMVIDREVQPSKGEKIQSSENSNSVCAKKNIVEAHSMISQDDERVIKIISLLNNEGCKAIGPILPPIFARTDRSEIRIFNVGDREDASAIAIMIERETGLRLEIKNMSEAVGGRVPNGRLEIWVN